MALNNSNSSSAPSPKTDEVRTADIFIFTSTFIVVFLAFTLGGVANVYALIKVRAAWRYSPMLCNLAVVGIVTCFLSAPAYATHMLLGELLNIRSQGLCQLTQYLWTASEVPLCVSLATIGIQRARYVFATFSTKPSPTFEFVAIGVSWGAMVPQFVMWNRVHTRDDTGSVSGTAEVAEEIGNGDGSNGSNDGDNRKLWAAGNEGSQFAWQPEYGSLLVVLLTLTSMFTAYMCTLWYLHYGVYQHGQYHPTSSATAEEEHTTSFETTHGGHSFGTSGAFRRRSMRSKSMRRSRVTSRGGVEETTVTYLLAKQVLMTHGWNQGSTTSTKDTPTGLSTCVETFPEHSSENPADSTGGVGSTAHEGSSPGFAGSNMLAPEREERVWSVSPPRRRSSLDVSTIYSLRQKDLRGAAAQLQCYPTGRISLPGCISPDLPEDPNLSAEAFKHQWKLQRSYRSHFREIDRDLAESRISEESGLHLRQPGSPWADPITPPFDSHSLGDPFNDGGRSYPNDNTNRLSPHTRNQVFSLSSLSSDAESQGKLSLISLSSRRNSSRRGSRNVAETWLKALRKISLTTRRKSFDVNNTLNQEMMSRPVKLVNACSQTSFEKESSAKPGTSAPVSNQKEEGKDEEEKSNHKNEASNLPSIKDEASPGHSPLSFKGRKKQMNHSSKSGKNKKCKVQQAKEASPSWKSEAHTTFNLPPLKHERLNASESFVCASDSSSCLQQTKLPEQDTAGSSTPVAKAEVEEPQDTQVSKGSLASKASKASKVSKASKASKGSKTHSAQLSIADNLSTASASFLGARPKGSSQLSEVDIFQFLAETEDKQSCISSGTKSRMAVQCSSSMTRLGQRHSVQSEPVTGPPIYRPKARMSMPAGVELNIPRQLNYSPPRQTLASFGSFFGGQQRTQIANKHGGAYYAGKKAAWLMTYFVITMLPLAICKAVQKDRDCSELGPTHTETLLQALAYICFIINPFSYILSNKNLLRMRAKMTEARRPFY